MGFAFGEGTLRLSFGEGVHPHYFILLSTVGTGGQQVVPFAVPVELFDPTGQGYLQHTLTVGGEGPVEAMLADVGCLEMHQAALLHEVEMLVLLGLGEESEGVDLEHIVRGHS